MKHLPVTIKIYRVIRVFISWLWSAVCMSPHTHTCTRAHTHTHTCMYLKM